MRRASAAFRRRYGASWGHLVVLLCSFGIAGYAGVRLLSDDPIGVLLWIVGAAILHDLVLLPLYSLVDRGVRALPRPHWRAPGARTRPSSEPTRGARPWVNAVRVPAFLAGLLLLVWFPLISGRTARKYEETAAMAPSVFLERWLAVTAALFAASALWLGVRVWLSRRARRNPRSATGTGTATSGEAH